jgi:alpha-amylase
MGHLLISILAFVCLIVDVSGQYYGNYFCRNGTDVVVHLFEWKWTDVEKECSWLAQNGYCAVQVYFTKSNIA